MMETKVAEGSQRETNSRFLSRSDLSELLRVSPLTLKKWHQRGTGPSYRKINGHVLYERSEVMAFIEACPRIGRSIKETADRELQQGVCSWVESGGEECGRIFFRTRMDMEVCPAHSGARRAKLQRERSAKARKGKA